MTELLRTDEPAAASTTPGFNDVAHRDDEFLLTVYRRRARQLAQPRAAARTRRTLENVLIVAVGAERYGIPLRDVRHVCRCSPLTQVPGSREELLGLANVQEAVRSVYALTRLLGLDDSSTAPGYFLLIHAGPRDIVLAVDQLQETRPIDRGELESSSEAVSREYLPYVAGLTADNVVVLEISRFRQHPALAAARAAEPVAEGT
jgi:purine-binding chemotaxis protein CheW